MDPRDGAIYGMGSAPSFDASVLAKPFSESTYRTLTSRTADAPLVNRATESAYPTGSTFKPVTAFAALAGNLIDSDTTIDDSGSWDLGTQHYQNAGQASFGTIDVADALKVSSDIFFFQLGAQAADHDDLIQRWAARFGFGHRTGIDLPGEAPGLVPDPKWRTEGYKAYRACVEKAHLTAGTWAALYKCGGIDKPWTTGDNVNLAVGQGDLQATPLQLAVAYSAIANDGTIVRPHLGKAVEDGNGFPIHDITTDPRRHIKLDPGDRQTVLDGLAARGRPAGRHVGRRLQGLAEALPRLRQDRHRRARAEPGPGLVRRLRQRPQAPDRRRRDGREGRLRRRDRRARGAADPLKVVRRQGRHVPRGVERDAVGPPLARGSWAATRRSSPTPIGAPTRASASKKTRPSAAGRRAAARPRAGRRMGQRDVLGLDRRRAEPGRLVTGALQQRERLRRGDQPRRLGRQVPVAAMRGLAGDAEAAGDRREACAGLERRAHPLALERVELGPQDAQLPQRAHGSERREGPFELVDDPHRGPLWRGANAPAGCASAQLRMRADIARGSRADNPVRARRASPPVVWLGGAKGNRRTRCAGMRILPQWARL